MQPVADFDNHAHRNPHGCSAPLPCRRRRDGDHADRGVHRAGARDRDPRSRDDPNLRTRTASAGQGERVLFKTRNSGHAWKTDHFQKNYVYIPPEAARYLAERGVQTVGVDYLSVGGFERRRPGDPPHPARSRHLDHRRPDPGTRRAGRVRAGLPAAENHRRRRRTRAGSFAQVGSLARLRLILAARRSCAAHSLRAA